MPPLVVGHAEGIIVQAALVSSVATSSFTVSQPGSVSDVPAVITNGCFPPHVPLAASWINCAYSSAVANTVLPKSWMPKLPVIFSGFVPYVRDEPMPERTRYVSSMPVMSPVMLIS